MNRYVPKVGDNVKATLGENVLVGEVTDEYAGDLIEIMVSEDEGLTLERDAWHFEQIVSVPTKFGAVIRRTDGEMMILRSRQNNVLTHPWRFVEGGGMAATGAEATAGGFTVLFEGVDG